MSRDIEDEAVREPLLSRKPSPSLSSNNSSSQTLIETAIHRDVESDVLPETAVVGRNLSWSSAYILVMSRVIGSGIFATPGAILSAAGSPGLALSLWILGAILAACGMFVSLEYGAMLPRSGGDKVYLEFTYRHPKFLASTLVAVQAVLLGFTVSNCVIFSEYVFYACNIQPSDLAQRLLAAGLMTAVTVVHGCFLRTGITIQNSIGWVKIALVIFMVLTGFYVFIFGPVSGTTTAPGFENLRWSKLWQDTNWELGVLATALFKVFYSFAGLNNMNNVMNEVKDPVRTLRSVSITALVTSCAMYLLINIAYFAVVPVDEIKSGGEMIAALFFERTFGPTLGRILLPLGIAISAAGNVMVVTFALARVNQEVARQGFLPWSQVLASSKPFNSPLGGLLVHYVPSVLVILLAPSGDIYNFILDVESYPGQIYVLAISVGLLFLRRSRPDLQRPYKAWTPAVCLRIAFSAILLAAPFFPPKDGHGDVASIWYGTYAVVGIGILLFGVLYWYVWIIFLPRLGGYQLEEKAEVLEDGTSITKLVRVKDE